ncbi:excinuclease ABC subunit B, partial [Akkermansiaceae bacterium]|nr:excinuclease ABC subunit B [Akkermansiaceae bacterium]
MKCDSCQEKATVFYTQVTEGKLKKFVLCEACAQKKGITNVDDLLMGSDLLGNSLQQTKVQDIVAELNQEDCSSCGFSLDDFRKVGRLGCPECYQVFSRELAERLPS